jgi:hypothetical protein
VPKVSASRALGDPAGRGIGIGLGLVHGNDALPAEERLESRHGFWRGTLEDAVAFLACGIFKNGFARVGCPECHAEYLVAFSCQRRGFCPGQLGGPLRTFRGEGSGRAAQPPGRPFPPQ